MKNPNTIDTFTFILRRFSVLCCLLIVMLFTRVLTANAEDDSYSYKLPNGTKLVIDKKQSVSIKRLPNGDILSLSYNKIKKQEKVEQMFNAQKSIYLGKSLSNASDRKQVIRSLQQKSDSQLPIFRMGGEYGPPVIITGNVLVRFAKNVNESRIASWESENNMIRQRIVSKRLKIIEYQSGGGLAALEMTRLLLMQPDARILLVEPVVIEQLQAK